jgi:hypothetical protein
MVHYTWDYCVFHRHENVWWSQCIAPRMLNFGTGGKIIGQFQASGSPPPLWGKNHRYSLDKRLGWRSLSGYRTSGTH